MFTDALKKSSGNWVPKAHPPHRSRNHIAQAQVIPFLYENNLLIYFFETLLLAI